MIGENLKVLRKLKNLSQEDMAGKLNIPRSSYSGYENGAAEPSIELLLRLADELKINLDLLLREDLTKFSIENLSAIELEKNVINGSNLRILTVTTDSSNEDLIELIPENARAGYASGYADPEFIKVLPAFNLPFISKQKKCRAFPVSGDSMPPVSHGSFVVAEYVENWNMVRDGFPYIVVTKNEGIVFKIVYNQISEKHSLQLCSTNLFYQPYDIPVAEVLEVWKFVNYICSEINEFKPDDAEVSKSIKELQREVSELKSLLQA